MNYDQNNGQGGEEQTDTARELLPAGFYKARADKSSVRFGAAQSGNEQVAVTFDILDAKADGYQQRITWIGTLAAGALDITLDGLMAAGWTGDNLMTLDGVGDVECSLKIKHEDDREGVPRARVAFVNRAGGAFKFKTELDANAVASLSDRLAGPIMAARQRAAGKGGGGPTSGPARAPAGGGYGGGGGRAPARGAAQRPWDGTGVDPNSGGDDGIPFASCSPLDDPMMRGMATA